MSDLIQTLAVSAVALGAGAVVVWRIVAAVRPPKDSQGCASCALGEAMVPPPPKSRRSSSAAS